MTLYFATHNEDKLKEARQILGVEVVSAGFEVDEIQSLDPREVAVKKAHAYYAKLKQPIFVEDVSLAIVALNGLPGTYIDAFMKTLGNDGIVKLMRGVDNRRATAQATVVYVHKKGSEEVFVGRIDGKIAQKPRGGGFGWDPIFIPTGETKTFGEMALEEKNKYSMRAKALTKFKKWLQRSK